MDIGKSRRRAIARAATIVFLAALAGACADQTSGPAPVYIKNATPAPARVPLPLPPPRFVTVQNGQSVERIAHLNHVPVSAIVALNGLKAPYTLRPGTRLMMPDTEPAPVQQATRYIPPAPPPQIAAVPPIPLPPPRPETLAPPQPAAANPPPPASSPQIGAAPLTTAQNPPQKEAAQTTASPTVPATAKATPEVIPLDGPPPKQLAAAPNLSAAVAPPSQAAATPPTAGGSGPPSVLPPRNAAAALPLPGEPSVDWGSADAAQATAAGTSGGRFPWPVRGRVLASYGSTVGGGHNDGINIAAPRGTPVRAIDAGIVAYAGNEMKGYGNLVLIKHANGWISAYAHLDALTVKVGDKIAPGQPFARVGESGGVGEPQLHFELRRGKKPVDPKEFLAPAPSAAAPMGDKAG